MATSINEQRADLQEIGVLLRQQTLLAGVCLDRLDGLKLSLRQSSSGARVAAAVRELGQALRELGGLEKKQTAFLQRTGRASLSEALASQPRSAEKEAALRLLGDAQELQDRLRDRLESSKSLLERGRRFVDFNVNLMSGAAASATYAPPGSGAGEVQRERKIFEADI